MLDIKTEVLGKKYFREWIFRKMDFHFRAGTSYAIIGPNGSGKSTLLKTLSGAIPATEGKISYLNKKNQELDPDLWPRNLSFAAPYLELIEEFTLQELLQFHFSFKSPSNSMEKGPEIAEKMYLQDAWHKEIKYFSSGMKQRLKLGLSFFSQSPILLLDEPTSNLDSRGIDWYLQQIDYLENNRLIIICSNQQYEYGFCKKVLNMEELKKIDSSK